MTKIFFLVSTSVSSADSLMVFVQPLYAMACINVCMCVKNVPNTASESIVRHMKMLHMLVGMGGTALVAAVALPR